LELNVETQRNELIALAVQNGWKCTEIDNFEAQNWSVETWLLESVWSPVDGKTGKPNYEQLFSLAKPVEKLQG
jgi:hypothetical protein